MGAILQHLMEDHGASMAEAKAALRDWEVRPFELGEIMLRENEIHFALDKDKRRVLGRLDALARLTRELLTEKGFLVTRLFPHDKKRRREVEFMGFRHTHSDEQYDYFWMDEPFERTRS